MDSGIWTYVLLYCLCLILLGLASGGAPAELASPVLAAPISWILH